MDRKPIGVQYIVKVSSITTLTNTGTEIILLASADRYHIDVIVTD